MATTPPTTTLDDVKKTLIRTARNLLNLKVVTVIGEADITIGQDDRATVTALKTVESSMTTNINLIEGDIWTVIGKDMVTGDYTGMRAYHETMVERADTIVNRNLEVVSSIIDKIAAMERDPATK